MADHAYLGTVHASLTSPTQRQQRAHQAVRLLVSDQGPAAVDGFLDRHPVGGISAITEYLRLSLTRSAVNVLRLRSMVGLCQQLDRSQLPSGASAQQ
jgi:hypothetical protein